VVEQSRVTLAHLNFIAAPVAMLNNNHQPGGPMANHIHDSNFEITSKRRKGFPSETRVKRGVRVVHGNKEL